MSKWADRVDSLNGEEFRELIMAVNQRLRRESSKQARTVSLNTNELMLVGDGKKIEAIKALRGRSGLGLMVCKLAVEAAEEKSRNAD